MFFRKGRLPTNSTRQIMERFRSHVSDEIEVAIENHRGGRGSTDRRQGDKDQPEKSEQVHAAEVHLQRLVA